MIHVSRQELVANQANPETAVSLATGGYLGALGVYHELHCIVS